MTASTKEKATEAEAAPAKGGKKMMIILLVVLLAAGGAAYFFLSSAGSSKGAPTPGAVIPLDAVAVNLAGGGYLKVGVALQLTAAAGAEKLDGSKAKDLIIATFSGAAPADVSGARDALKESLQKKIIKAYGATKVMGIYYTDYVTQ
jgi:flagellar FliL protein